LKSAFVLRTVVPSAIQIASAPKPQSPFRATTSPMAPNWRFEKMSDADKSRSASRPRIAVVPLIAAPMK
jgi:hypothetical protein